MKRSRFEQNYLIFVQHILHQSYELHTKPLTVLVRLKTIYYILKTFHSKIISQKFKTKLSCLNENK